MDALNLVLVVIVALYILVKEAVAGICRTLASLNSDTKVSDFFFVLLPFLPSLTTSPTSCQ